MIFFISTTDDKEIILFISSLNSNKSSGPYIIPRTILQLVKNDIAKPLSEIINLSFATGQLASKVKNCKTHAYL